MKKRNILIISLFVICFLVILPSLITRVDFENSHKGYAVALSYNAKMGADELKIFADGGIDTLIIDETVFADKVKECKELGFNIALKINLANQKAERFEEFLDRMVKEYGVKYLIITNDSESTGYRAPLENVIKDNNITLVVKESKNQVSNEKASGYEDYIKASNGKVLRAYETLKNPLRTLNSESENSKSGELLLSHMINSARDRNTEFIILNKIETTPDNAEEDIEQTIYASKEFKKWMNSKGYKENGEISLNGYEPNLKLSSALSFTVSVLMVMVMFIILSGKRNKVFEYIFLLLSVLSFGFAFLIPEKYLLYLPTLLAPLFASFSFAVSIKCAKVFREKYPPFKAFLLSFTIAFASLLYCACFMASLLSGKDFYLNNILFRGVKLSLILPVLFSVFVMWIFSSLGKTLKEKGLRGILKEIKPVHIIIFTIIGLAGIIYILRSGNAKISPIENEIRNYMALLTGARPRTKEFLIGWPVFALSVFYMKEGKSKLVRFATGVGASVLFASVINTFCHVFTDFGISFIRTVYGLLFSLPIVALALFVNYICIKLLRK